MQILVLSQYWWPENGVPQRRWSWLTSILIKQGHEVYVIAPPPREKKSTSVGVFHRHVSQTIADPEVGPSGEYIYRCGYLPTNSSLTYRALNQAFVALSTVMVGVRLCRDGRIPKPELLVGTVPALPTALATRLLAKLLQVRYVIDLRDAWPDLVDYSALWNQGVGKMSRRERVLRRGPVQLVSRYVKKMLPAIYKRSSAMILTSDYLRESLQERMRAGDRLEQPCFVTIRNVFPAQVDARGARTEAKTPGELNVLYAGTLGRAQQLSNAVEAVRIAREKGYEVNLRLVGAGATSGALRAQVRATDLPIKIYGKANPETLSGHYEWADTALVHLTDWEPLKAAVPSKTFELMRMGIHISGSVAGEAADLIESLEAGDVVPPQDPLALANLWCELIDDRSRLSISAKARSWIDQEESVETPRKVRALIQSIKDQH